MKVVEIKGNLGGFRVHGKTPEGTCPDCAVAHPADLPHNQQSLHWQYRFREKHGRWPTWHDAMRHCTAEMKDCWLRELSAAGVDAGPDPVTVDHESVRAMVALGTRALSVRQPWAWLIVNGHKPFENRDWSPKNPGRMWLEKRLSHCLEGFTILIHAAKGMTGDEYDQAYFMAQGDYNITLPAMKDLPRGGIVGVANAVRWHDTRPALPYAFGSGIELEAAAPREFLPCKGALGFFQPKLEQVI